MSGVLPAKIEFSNWLKVKSELCSPHSFYQFKHVLCKEEVEFFKLLVFLKNWWIRIQSVG